MCTLVILRRPGQRWPLLLGANRDEQRSRVWLPPGRHWPDQPRVVGGLDCLAGGSWLGVSDAGVLATVANRSSRPEQGRSWRSRGTLVLTALRHGTAAQAAARVATQSMLPYQPFNLLAADAEEAWWVSLREPGAPRAELAPVPAGLVMLSNGETNDPDSARIRHNLRKFGAAPPPDPDRGDWRAWERLLASRRTGSAAQPLAAMNISRGSVGTVCSSLIALPAADWSRCGVWRFAAGAPHRTPFLPVPH